MQGFKEFFESLSKMTNVKLNMAIFIVCLSLIILSPKEKFILDPIPKIIPQLLILATSIRLMFSLINSIHTAIEGRREKSAEQQRASDLEGQVDSCIRSLDIFQLFVIKKLIGQNNISQLKGAILFSLKNQGVVYAVATGASSEGISLTKTAKKILIEKYNNDTTELEKEAIKRFYLSLNDVQINSLKFFLEVSKTKSAYVDRNRRMQYSEHHKVLTPLENTILFKHPHETNVYEITDIAKDILVEFYGNNEAV